MDEDGQGSDSSFTWCVHDAAPYIFQTDNGCEFKNKLIESLKELWLELNIVHGKPQHLQSQGSVEWANWDVQDMVITWKSENRTKMWSQGLRFVQVGHLQQLYTLSQFMVCAEKFVDESDIPDTTISLGSATTRQSIEAGGHGQGFLHCNCSKGCATKACSCWWKGVLCNHKCHSTSCSNKWFYHFSSFLIFCLYFTWLNTF